MILVFLKSKFSQIFNRKLLIAGTFCVALLFVFYLAGIGRNPPGFYLDESFVSYQAYLVSQTGRNEFGEFLPVFFPAFPRGDGTYDGYANPVYIYVLAALNLIFAPSVALSKTVSATGMFFACLLLGWIAYLMAERALAGIIIAVMSLLTPWLFEMSRLVFEAAILPLAVVLFLTTLFYANRAKQWTLIHSALVAACLALVTYTYSIGRLLGPGLAVGLFLLVANRQRLTAVLKTLAIYTVLLLPAIVYGFKNPGMIFQRYNSVSIFTPDMTVFEKISTFIQAYFSDVGPQNLLFSGDPLPRHHIPVMGMVFAASVVLGIIGVVISARRSRENPWYRYLLFGLMISVVPGALTVSRAHMLRLSAFPIFLLLLNVPALQYFFGAKTRSASNLDDPVNPGPKTFHWDTLKNGHVWRIAKISILALLLVSIAVQATVFQKGFRELATGRGVYFDDAYPGVMAIALAQPQRPIYLEDGFWGPGYIHAYWYAAVQGIDPSNFVHLSLGEKPPQGAVVLSSADVCADCEVVEKRGSFMYYRKMPTSIAQISVRTIGKGRGSEPGQFAKPHGIAVDERGNIYVADSGNGRVQKFSSNGAFIGNLGKTGPAAGETREPTGIAIDPNGDIYVTDSLKNSLIKYDADGKFLRQWTASEIGLVSPGDISFAEDKKLYIIDRGKSSVIKLDPENGTTSEWPNIALTGIASGAGIIFAANIHTDRVEVFDPNGNVVGGWPVPQWNKYIWHLPDVAVDNKSRLVYVTSGWTNEILVFDFDGHFLKSLKPELPQKLNNPSSIVLSDTKAGKFLYVLNTGSNVVETGSGSVTIFDLSDADPVK